MFSVARSMSMYASSVVIQIYITFIVMVIAIQCNSERPLISGSPVRR